MLKAINDRRAVRQYKSDPVSDSEIQELVAAFQAAPCGMHKTDEMQGLVVKNADLRQKIEDATDNSCYGAPLLFLLLTKKGSQFGERNASVAAENIMVEAADLGLNSVYVMSGAVKLNQHPDLLKELGVSDDFEVMTVVPVGHGAGDVDKPDRSNRYQLTIK